MQSGKVEVWVWAAGAVHAIGIINFLFDKALPVNMTPIDIKMVVINGIYFLY